MSFYRLFNIVILFLITYSRNCRCEMLDTAEENTISLASLQKMQHKDIVSCLIHLGQKPLHSSEAVYIWQSIKTYYGDVSNIPDTILATLQWVTPAIPPQDYFNITLNDIDVIQNFGKDYELNEAQLTAIVERIRDDFKEPEEYTYHDLVALRQILCAFSGSEIQRIHAKAYKAAFVEIGELKRCSEDVLRGFAKLAVENSAFGPAEYWNDAILAAIGAVGEYLPKKINKFKESQKLFKLFH